MSKNLVVGETVWALWPGSKKYYEATVLNVRKSTVEVDFKDGYVTEVSHRQVFKETSPRFRSRSTSPSRVRRRSRSPGRARSRSRSRSPARGRGLPSSPKTSKETLVQQVTQQATVSPSRRSPRRALTSETKVEKTSTVTTVTKKVTSDSSTVNTTRVTRSVTKKLIAEEKEALPASTDIKPAKRSHEYEFGGAFGVFVMMIVLPAVVVGSYLFCNAKSCSVREVPSTLPPLWAFKGAFFDVGHLIVDGWIIFHVIIHMLPIGKVAQGQVLADGHALDYRLNGFLALMISVIGFAACLYFKVDVTLVYDSFLGITTATICWSFFIAFIVYIKARIQKTGLSPKGNTGNSIYDFFVGHQLNPRWGKFDFKFFFQSQPGLIGWVIINLCMAVKEYQEPGGLSTAMILVCVFQFVCVADVLLHEESLLSTLDESGFGFMIAFCGLSWIPIMYSLQARYLVDNRVDMSWTTATPTVILFVIGYTIFRGSNSQKFRFRANPLSEEFRDAETIMTSSGKRLLVSGWWGLVRHPNYLGDIIMAFAWTFPCGFNHAIPYFYPVFVTFLLVDRELRDEKKNRLKYGTSWDEYCRRVPYRILPKIF